MYKCINGWTKEKVLEVLRNRQHIVKAYDEKRFSCAYLTSNGNKCAVGLFIPDGHDGQLFRGNVKELLKLYFDLKKIMPLNNKALLCLQSLHDDAGMNEDIKAQMIEWVEKYVE